MESRQQKHLGESVALALLMVASIAVLFVTIGVVGGVLP